MRQKMKQRQQNTTKNKNIKKQNEKYGKKTKNV